ncbi:MAG: glycosyltransferase family 9 protein, partial [Candidatus Firestonebacteria bacterium]|nr:glycosyltransferase family 9 protein [Candidatus Firestonebacteria bacterium]
MKILLRSPNWVGDAIMATPVPRLLRQTWPACRIHVLAKPWTAPVWEQHPDVEKIIPLAQGRAAGGAQLRELRGEKYDLGLVLPNSFSAAWLTFRAGCRERVGYATEHRGWLLTRRLPWSRAVREGARPQAYLRLAQAAGGGGTEVQERPFILQVTPAELAHAAELMGNMDRRPWVGLAPGSVASSRRWPAERFARLADRLRQNGCRVVLVGSGADAQ